MEIIILTQVNIPKRHRSNKNPNCGNGFQVGFCTFELLKPKYVKPHHTWTYRLHRTISW